MRFCLTTLFLACVGVPCFAQSEAFNPYRAVVDAMPLQQAEPLIQSLYGPVGPADRLNGLFGVYDEGSVLALMPRPTEAPAYLFLFCEERLAAVSAPVTAAMAADILKPLTGPGSNTSVHPDDGGIRLQTKNDTLTVEYRDVGTKKSMVVLTYPQKVYVEMDFAGRCAELAE
ncbi:MAG: hypothetical protein KME20_27740 [Kaiparowitsia implicata GSE-PSE-MK54-09C]|jgi:hypothetical protein|nr:hypothetical protein [Kaiparowitsia implicata GSE-PSE-MK54-09C]